MSYRVRHAAPEDAPAIAGVARGTWAETYRGIIPEEIQQAVLPQWYAEERLARAAANPESAFFVAEDQGGQVVGFAQAGSRQEAGDAELWRIYVLDVRDVSAPGWPYRLRPAIRTRLACAAQQVVLVERPAGIAHRMSRVAPPATSRRGRLFFTPERAQT